MARIYRYLDTFGSLGSGDGQFNFGTSLGVGDIDIDENYIYIADYNNSRVQIFNNTSPYAYVDKILGVPGAGLVRVDNNYIYTGVNTGTTSPSVVIRRKTSPYDIVYSWTVSPTYAGFYAWDLYDNYLYIAYDNNSFPGIFKHDMATGALVSSTSVLSYCLFIYGNYLFTYNNSDELLKKYNFPAMTLAASINVGYNAYDIQCDGDYVYAIFEITQQNKLKIYDMGLTTSIGYFGNTGSTVGCFSGYPRIKYYNNKLYVLDEGNNRIQVFDWKNLVVPNIPANMSLACADNNRVLVSWEIV